MDSNKREEEEPFFRAMDLISMPVASSVVKAIIELGVLDIMAAAGPGAELFVEDIVAQLPLRNTGAAAVLDRLMSFLASSSIVRCTVVDDNGHARRRYGLEPVCRLLLKTDDGMSLAPLFLFQNDQVIKSCIECIKDTVIEGSVPFNKAHGMSAYEYFGTDPSLNHLFNQALAQKSAFVMNKILDVFKGFEGITELMDVGGGNGDTLAMIVSRYPHIKGINFDQPHVISNAPTIPGVEHVGGDMFLEVPCARTILLKHVLPNWSDEYCLKILKNCWKALPDSGKVFVVDWILPEAPKADLSAQAVYQLDLYMLTNTKGGKERTEKEFKHLAKEAGFTEFKISRSALIIYIMELTK